MQAKQPSSLYVLFSAEMWERFGFYFVQSLMTLYLTSQLGFSDVSADSLYSAFTGLLYAAPVVGGLLADYVLGFRRAIICGALFYTLGYFLMLSHSSYGFFLALSMLVAGNGYFKANISSFLGTFYSENDPRRDSGFTIFYLGINVGSFFGPIAAALITEKYGYHYGFASCGIGMLFGLGSFLWGRKYLGNHGIHPANEKNTAAAHAKKSKQRKIVYILSIIFVLGLSFLMKFSNIVNYAIALFCIASVIYLLYITVGLTAKEARLKIVALIILFIFSILFWAFYMQMYTSVNLFTDRSVDRVVDGWTIPTPALTSIIGIFIILLSPFFAKLWFVLKDSKWNPTFATKFALGHLFQGICFVALIAGIWFHNDHNQMTLFWLILSGFFRVLGELCLSPIGLSAVTRLAPQQLTGMIMGLWFLTISGGVVLSNRFAILAAVPKNITSPVAKLAIYNHAFIEYAVISLASAAALFILTPFVNRLSGEHAKRKMLAK